MPHLWPRCFSAVGGGKVRQLALLRAAADPKAADISPQQLHRLWEGEQQAGQQAQNKTQQAQQPGTRQQEQEEQAQQQQVQRHAQQRPPREVSEDERVVRAWMEVAMQEQQQDAVARPLSDDTAAAGGGADANVAEDAPRKSRKLKQDPYGAAELAWDGHGMAAVALSLPFLPRADT